jgi:hypothetical protein
MHFLKLNSDWGFSKRAWKRFSQEENNTHLLATINDVTYEKMEIYQVGSSN